MDHLVKANISRESRSEGSKSYLFQNLWYEQRVLLLNLRNLLVLLSEELAAWLSGVDHCFLSFILVATTKMLETALRIMAKWVRQSYSMLKPLRAAEGDEASLILSCGMDSIAVQLHHRYVNPPIFTSLLNRRLSRFWR